MCKRFIYTLAPTLVSVVLYCLYLVDVAVAVREVVVGTGEGFTTEEAQRAAARQALQYFYTRGLPGGNIEPYLTPMEIFLKL